MNTGITTLLGIGRVALLLTLSGCGTASEAPKVSQENSSHHQLDAPEIKANLAKLSDDDRLLAETQGFCATSEEPLGAMGKPLKLIVNEHPVFVCCKGCEKKAKLNPDKTLAKVEQLKAKTKTLLPVD